MSTAISAPGTYTGSGDFHLTGNIAGSLVFTGAARLFGRGFTVQGSSSGNTWDTGISFQAGGSLLVDTKVKGFRVGVKLEGAGSGIIGCDLSQNRYFGAWLTNNDQYVIGGKIGSIAGVTDEKYAIGVQCDADNPLVEGVQFDEMYPQAGYTGSGAGEGLPVNFAATSTGGIMRRCTCINQTPMLNTYGVFGGAGGGHNVHDNLFHNFWRAIAAANVGAVEIKGNRITTDKQLAGDQGIGCEGGDVERNVIIGYTAPIIGPHWSKNVALTFPTAQDDPPPNGGTGGDGFISFLGHANDPTNATAFTFNSQPFGTAHADRQIIVGIGSRANAARSISAVTIGGVSATLVGIANDTGGGADLAALYRANVPSGTSGQVVVTFSGEMLRCGIALWNLVTATPAPHDVETDTGAGNHSVAIDVPANGGAVAMGWQTGSTSMLSSWSGIVEDCDVQPETIANNYSGAHANFATAQTGLAVSNSNANTVANGGLVVASFGP